MANRDTDYITIGSYLYKYMTYVYDDVNFFAPASRQGSPRYQDFVPETVIAWRSWHFGYGEYYYSESGDPLQVSSNVYYDAEGIDASVEQQITLGPAVNQTFLTTGASVGDTVDQFIDYRGVQYAIGQKNAFRWDPTASPNGWSLSGSFGNVQTGQATVYAIDPLAGTAILPSDLYLMVPTASHQWFYNGATWRSVATQAAHLLTIRNELWKAYTDSTTGIWYIAKSVDGVTYPNGLTTTNYKAGSGVATVNSLLNYDNRLFWQDTQGVKAIDQFGTIYDMLPEIGNYGDLGLGKGAAEWHGVAYIPSNTGLLQLHGSNVLNTQTSQAMVSIGQDRQSWSKSEVRGKYAALAPHVNYLYGTMNAQSGNGFILKYRQYPNNTPNHGWHPLVKFEGQTMHGIKVSALPWYGTQYPILWTGVDNDIYMTRLPSENDNTLLDGNTTYQTQGHLDLPIIDANIPTFKKSWIQVVVDLINQDQTIVQVQASFDGGAFTTLGSIDRMTGVFEYDFASVLASASFTIQLRLSLYTRDITQTPVIRSVALHFVFRPPLRGQWHLELLPQEAAVPNDNNTSQDKVLQLKAARNEASLVNFIDVDGTNYQVTVEKMSLKLQAREANRGAQMVASVTLQDYALPGWYFDSFDAIFDDAANFAANLDTVIAAYFDSYNAIFDYSRFS
jgi:hypothetical protein